jgi:DNA-binding response OmpR family regulator
MFFPEVALREVLPMLRVLVVDDESDTTDAMRIPLETWGFVGLTTGIGLAAVKTAAAFRPDVVLLNVGLPGMDSLLVARQIRQLGGKQPIIICINGSGQDEDHRRALEAGCDHSFVKPADLDELKAMLRVLEAGYGLNA